MTFVFYVSRPIYFENQCGSAEKTNKPPKNTHGTSQRKCEMWCIWSCKKRSPEVPSTTPLTKQLISNRPPSCSAAKNKQRKATWADLFCRFFELAIPVSPDQWARTPRHSERTCVREWSSDGRTSSSFFSVKVNVWPTESYHKPKKTFLGISPRRHVPESTMMIPQLLQCSKATDRAIETGGTVIHFEDRCTAKNNFD